MSQLVEPIFFRPDGLFDPDWWNDWTVSSQASISFFSPKGLSVTFFTKFLCPVPHMVSLRPDVSICHNAKYENKCQQLLTLPFVSISIFLIRYLSVELSRLTTVSIYSGRLPVVMTLGFGLRSKMQLIGKQMNQIKIPNQMQSIHVACI